MSTELTEEQKKENIASFGKDVANILLNIPAKQRDWVFTEMPAELFGALCAFYDSKSVKDKIEFYFTHPEKQFWKTT